MTCVRLKLSEGVPEVDDEPLAEIELEGVTELVATCVAEDDRVLLDDICCVGV